MRHRFRKGAGFIMNPRAHSTSLDRNQRARLVHQAEAIELRTKRPGCRNGALGLIGLQVLRVLLFKFHRKGDGLCCPSYTSLQKATGLCRQSIANALKRLARCGILAITRRLVRERFEVIVVCRQGSNLYGFRQIEVDTVVARLEQLLSLTTVSPFPSRKLPLLSGRVYLEVSNHINLKKGRVSAGKRG